MEFSEPYWFWALLFLPLWCLAVIWQARRRRVAWQKLVAENLQQGLVKHSSSRLKRVVYVLVSLSYVCMVFAMARPYTGSSLQQYQQVEQRVFFALDSSASMYVKDLGQSRLDYAKDFIYDFLQLNPQMQCGLINFSGDANLILPFTQDHALLVQSLDQIRADSQSSGSDYNAVFELLDLLPQKTLAEPFALVLLSDGGQTQPLDLGLLKRFGSSRMSVVCVGIGSVQGALIPDAKAADGLWRDARGASAVSRYNEASLLDLAQNLQGDYLYAKQDSASRVAEILKQKLGTDQISRRSSLVLHEVYGWFACAALLLLLAALLLSQRWGGWKRSLQDRLALQSGSAVPCVLAMTAAAILTADPLCADRLERLEQLVEQRNYAESLKLAGEELKNPDLSKQQRAQLSFLEGYSAQALRQYDFAVQSYSRALMMARSEEQISQIKFNLAATLAQAGLEVIARDQKIEDPTKIKEFKLSSQENLAKVKLLWQDALGYYQSVGAGQLQQASELDRRNLDKALQALQLQQNPSGQAQQGEEPKKDNNNSSTGKNDQKNPGRQDPSQQQQDPKPDRSPDKQKPDQQQPGQDNSNNAQSSGKQQPGSSGQERNPGQNPDEEQQDPSSAADPKRSANNSSQGSTSGSAAEGLQADTKQTPAAERQQRQEALRILRNSMDLEQGALFRTPKRSNNTRDPQH